MHRGNDATCMCDYSNDIGLEKEKQRLLEPTCSCRDLPMMEPGPCSVIALTVSLNQPKPLSLIRPNLHKK